MGRVATAKASPVSRAQTEKAQARQFYRENFYDFTKDILDYKDLKFDIHVEVCDFLVRAPGNGSIRTSNIPSIKFKKQFREKPEVSHKLLLLPRGAFKSTIATVSYPIWRWLSDPTITVMIASYNIKKARDFLTEIKYHLSDNKKLRALFGNFGKAKTDGKKGKWSDYEIQLFNPYTNEYVAPRNMNSAMAVGLETGIAGLHPKIFIPDDTICDQNISTLDALDKVKEYFQQKEAMMISGSEIIIVGTRYDWRDAYQNIIENGQYDVMLRSCYNPDGSLWFPERLNENFLKAKKLVMDPYFFSCQMENNPVNPKDQKFKEEWLKRCMVERCELKRDEMTVMMWVDPALKATKYSDYCAMMITGMDKASNLWILYTLRERISDKAMINTMLDVYQVWKPETIFCETNAAQKLIIPLLDQIAKERDEIYSITPNPRSTTTSKDFCIRALYRYVEHGKIKICEDQTDLIDEMRRYPKGHDDLLDTLSQAAINQFEPDWVEHVTEVDIQKARLASWDKSERDGYWKPPHGDGEKAIDIIHVWG